MNLVVRRPVTDDRASWSEFLTDVPTGEERFFVEDLADRAGFRRWVEDPGMRVAVVDGRIAGAAGAHPGRGWSSHNARMSVIVRQSQRGNGIGRELARAALLTAIELGCTHVHVEVVAEQAALIAMFRRMGFEATALLPDFVRDGTGQLHDLILLSHDSPSNWAALTAVGIDGEQA